MEPLHLPGAGEPDSEKHRKEAEEQKTHLDKVKKPENIGFLAVESQPDEPSLLERVLSKTKREPEAEKTPEALPTEPVRERPEPILPELNPVEADLPPLPKPVETTPPEPSREARPIPMGPDNDMAVEAKPPAEAPEVTKPAAPEIEPESVHETELLAIPEEPSVEAPVKPVTKPEFTFVKAPEAEPPKEVQEIVVPAVTEIETSVAPEIPEIEELSAEIEHPKGVEKAEPEVERPEHSLFADRPESTVADRPLPPEAAAVSEAARSSIAAEENMSVESAPKGALADRRVETMDRAELMGLAEKIIIDDKSLRQLYETHLVGERGLRRLIAEYQNGGDLQKALRREVMEHEIDFERDPAMRDLALSAAAPTASSIADNSSLETLVQRATNATPAGNGSASSTALPHPPTSEAADHFQQPQHRVVVDVIFFSIICLLALFVIFLYLKRA